jgi:hypothetical protein
MAGLPNGAVQRVRGGTMQSIRERSSNIVENFSRTYGFFLLAINPNRVFKGIKYLRRHRLEHDRQCWRCGGATSRNRHGGVGVVCVFASGITARGRAAACVLHLQMDQGKSWRKML